ncbi:MAG: CheY-like chemotaxis protein [Enterobacterales bacterium]
MGPDYSHQKVLIIDDFPEFRISMKGMVQQLGAQEIDLASTGEMGLEKCVKTRYDIILSDYNLGDGKDGQQVLEELIHRDHLKPTTVYVLITAENTTEMVMGALEHTPDSYLTKPFTQALLRSRLDKLLAKKFALENVNRAIISKNYLKATQYCDVLIANRSKYSMSCMKIKAGLFDKMGDYGQSKKIYTKVIAHRPVPWALMGMGKLLYAQDDYEEALVYFRQVIKIMSTFPEALDWLARVQQVLGNPLDAQKTLQSAIKVSPKAILRQMHLGNLAFLNKDYDVARRAYKASVKLGRTSCYKTPNNYLKLVSILKEYITNEGGIKNKRLVDEAFRVISELEDEYTDDKEIKLRAVIAKHSIYHKLEKHEEAQKNLDSAKKRYESMKESLSGIGCSDMAKACKDGEDFETCQDILSNVFEKFGDDKELMASLEGIVEDKVAFEKAVQAREINNRGMKASSNNDTDAAIVAFREALQMSPENISFNMNLAQMLIRKTESSENKDEMLDEALACLSKLEYLKETDHRYLRYQQLLRIVNDLKIGVRNS